MRRRSLIKERKLSNQDNREAIVAIDLLRQNLSFSKLSLKKNQN
jgi:hypothetical protein